MSMLLIKNDLYDLILNSAGYDNITGSVHIEHQMIYQLQKQIYLQGKSQKGLREIWNSNTYNWNICYKHTYKEIISMREKSKKLF